MGGVVLSHYHSFQLPRRGLYDGGGGFRVLWAVEDCSEADVESGGAEEGVDAVQSPEESCADAPSLRRIDFRDFFLLFLPSPPPSSLSPSFLAIFISFT